MSERLDHPVRRLPATALVGGDLHILVYGTPIEELEHTAPGHAPRWVERIYESYGHDPSDPPLSASVEAVAEGLHHRLDGLALILRKAERRGWKAHVDENELVIFTGLAEEEVMNQLEADGVLSLVQEFAGREPGHTAREERS